MHVTLLNRFYTKKYIIFLNGRYQIDKKYMTSYHKIRLYHRGFRLVLERELSVMFLVCWVVSSTLHGSLTRFLNCVALALVLANRIIIKSMLLYRNIVMYNKNTTQKTYVDGFRGCILAYYIEKTYNNTISFSLETRADLTFLHINFLFVFHFFPLLFIIAHCLM